MSETHRRKIIGKEEFCDRAGRKRERLLYAYERSEETQLEMEKRRLGVYNDVEPTDDERVLVLLEKNQLVFQVSYFVAKRIVSTKIRKGVTYYRDFTGGDILSIYFDKEVSSQLMSGFVQSPQLFIYFGYSEGVVNHLPSLIVQLVGQRYHLGMHVWLFIPKSLGEMDGIWGSSVFKELSYLPLVGIESLEGVVETNKGPEPSLLKGSSRREISSKDANSDPKLRRKGGGRKS